MEKIMGFSAIWKTSWNSMKGKWGTLVGVVFCYNLIMGAVQQSLGALGTVLLAPLTAGCNTVFLSLLRGEDIKFGLLFSKFDDFGRFVWGVLRVTLFTLLWGLLFIIPGIIAYLRYSQALWLMIDDPSLEAKEAMEKSSELMKGHKWRLFCYTSFFMILIVLTAVATLCIGFLWLLPFLYCFMAQFYLSLRESKGMSAEILAEPIQTEVPSDQD